MEARTDLPADHCNFSSTSRHIRRGEDIRVLWIGCKAGSCDEKESVFLTPIDQEKELSINFHPHSSPIRRKAGLRLGYPKQGQIDIETEIWEAITGEQFLVANPLLSPVGTTGDQPIKLATQSIWVKSPWVLEGTIRIILRHGANAGSLRGDTCDRDIWYNMTTTAAIEQVIEALDPLGPLRGQYYSTIQKNIKKVKKLITLFERAASSSRPSATVRQPLPRLNLFETETPSQFDMAGKPLTEHWWNDLQLLVDMSFSGLEFSFTSESDRSSLYSP
ncbi:MAG: hypothetical protein J3Q66DRAFT_398873 [Benniella sp.]|nr:MAG: hypothetical protein J3Q66DRAFT_398873 [Benniella sp.]